MSSCPSKAKLCDEARHRSTSFNRYVEQAVQQLFLLADYAINSDTISAVQGQFGRNAVNPRML